jgi:hypothetical protein
MKDATTRALCRQTQTVCFQQLGLSQQTPDSEESFTYADTHELV